MNTIITTLVLFASITFLKAQNSISDTQLLDMLNSGKRITQVSTKSQTSNNHSNTDTKKLSDADVLNMLNNGVRVENANKNSAQFIDTRSKSTKVIRTQSVNVPHPKNTEVVVTQTLTQQEIFTKIGECTKEKEGSIVFYNHKTYSCLKGQWK